MIEKRGKVVLSAPLSCQPFCLVSPSQIANPVENLRLSAYSASFIEVALRQVDPTGFNWRMGYGTRREACHEIIMDVSICNLEAFLKIFASVDLRAPGKH